ncbi:hypothetical protein R1sor_014122 [Riccia sorocarpa]|uniref:Uncharacterized protein n=1 Tax=Riccia sorocarpa TaxID=122646 RepID=A0ABD3H8H5_9MARC
MSETSSGNDSDEPAVKRSRFLPLDPTEVANVEKGGRRRSRNSEQWAEKIFQDWLKAEGKDVSLSVADRSESEDVVAAGNEAVERSVRAGLGREVKKSSVLSLEEEKLILDQKICQIDTPTGLNYRMGFFCLRNFLIRGQKELRNVNIEDFQIVNLPIGQALRFTQGHNKNYRFSLARAGIEQHRPAVDCHLPDIISTFKQLESKRPKVWKKLKEPPHPLFLTPRQSFLVDDDVWFKEGPVGENTLAKYSARMTANLPTLQGKIISNKSLRSTAISRMAEALVPQQDGMRQTGHKDEKSYAKYIQNPSGVKDRAAQRIISGEVENGQLLTYEAALRDEQLCFARLQVNSACYFLSEVP